MKNSCLFPSLRAFLLLSSVILGGSFAQAEAICPGGHYNLNIIGVPKNKTASMTGDDGHRIFVPLNGKTRINLTEGAFAVLDGNATDGSGAFQLPNPDPDGDGVTTYQILARPLGKPGGKSTMTTCATDPATGEQVCSLQSVVSIRSAGKPKAVNVTKELTSLEVDLDGDGLLETISLFSDVLQDYYWSYDNQGLRLLQLRFCPR